MTVMNDGDDSGIDDDDDYDGIINGTCSNFRRIYYYVALYS